MFPRRLEMVRCESPGHRKSADEFAANNKRREFLYMLG